MLPLLLCRLLIGFTLPVGLAETKEMAQALEDLVNWAEHGVVPAP